MLWIILIVGLFNTLWLYAMTTGLGNDIEKIKAKLDSLQYELDKTKK